jgi:SnoaL-like domain/SCP-2 sterol transfer family
MTVSPQAAAATRARVCPVPALTDERARAAFARVAELHRSRDLAGVARVFTPNAVYEDDGWPASARGVTEIQAFFAAVWRAFTDFRVELINGPYLHPDGSGFSVRGRLSGQMTGDLHPPGFAATHGWIATEFAGFYELSGDMLCAGRILIDTTDLARQMGAVPAPGSGAERVVTAVQRLRARATRTRSYRRASVERVSTALQVLLARRIAALPEGRLTWIERGLVRRLIVSLMPAIMRLRVNRRLTREVRGVIELRLRSPDGASTDYLHVVLDGSHCKVNSGPSQRPTAALTMGLADMVRMAAGAVAVPTLLQEGRMCLIGDVTVIMRFPAVFRLPTRALV